MMGSVLQDAGGQLGGTEHCQLPLKLIGVNVMPHFAAVLSAFQDQAFSTF